MVALTTILATAGILDLKATKLIIRDELIHCSRDLGHRLDSYNSAQSAVLANVSNALLQTSRNERLRHEETRAESFRIISTANGILETFDSNFEDQRKRFQQVQRQISSAQSDRGLSLDRAANELGRDSISFLVLMLSFIQTCLQ